MAASNMINVGAFAGAAIGALASLRGWNTQDLAAQANVAIQCVSAAKAGRAVSVRTWKRIAAPLGGVAIVDELAAAIERAHVASRTDARQTSLVLDAGEAAA
jgi:hypothetical protein